MREEKVRLANQVTLHCLINPNEQKEWILLSNSLGATNEMWKDQIEVLSEHFQVLRYDTRGHGQSSCPQGPYSFDDLCEDVIGLLNYFEIEKANFMGLSLGGMTGLGLAINYPNRISRVVCADARTEATEMFKAMWDERIFKVASGGLNAILDGTITSWFTSDWIEANPSKIQTIKDMILSNNSKGYIYCCEALKELNYLTQLNTIKVPVLYVGGDQDKGAPPETMKEMADKTPFSIYECIANSAHVANINNADEFNQKVLSYLTNLD